MVQLRHRRLVRVVLVLLLALGVSAGLSARTQGQCFINCGDGCSIIAINCPDCRVDEGSCTIYWETPSCADRFYCSAGCSYCEVFAN